MKIPFSEIAPEGSRYHLDHVQVAADPEDFIVCGRVSLDCRLVRRDKQRVALTGHVRAELGLTCNRCLEQYPFAVDSEFSVILEPVEAATENYRLRNPDLPLDNLDVIEVLVPEVDLVEIVRQQLYLSLPVRQLCRDNCQGLCQGCGCNLNHKSCNCAGESCDSPFAVLALLKKEGK